MWRRGIYCNLILGDFITEMWKRNLIKLSCKWIHIMNFITRE